MTRRDEQKYLLNAAVLFALDSKLKEPLER